MADLKIEAKMRGVILNEDDIISLLNTRSFIAEAYLEADDNDLKKNLLKSFQSTTNKIKEML